MTSRIQMPQLAIGASLGCIALGLAVGASRFPADAGFSVMGPSVVPFAIATFAGILSIGLLLQAVTGGFRNLSVDAYASGGSRWGVAWVSAGLLLNAILIDRIGFVLAGTLLFAIAARGFGSRRWITNIVVAASVALPVYWAFGIGLGVSLPRLFNQWI